ncbi:MAG: hypothetical protein WAT39_14105 [Planctomycetota bacterium]
MRPTPLSFLLCFCVAACADGGEEDRPKSEVSFSAQHHLFGFRTLRGFESFPVPGEAVESDRGTLNLFDDSTWTVTRSGGTSNADRYALERPGDLSIFVTGNGRTEPSVVFLGGYGLVGASDDGTPGVTPDFFFTDRVSTPASEKLGFYVGTRLLAGQVELAGAWHVLSLHVVLPSTLLLLDPDNVARAARGSVTVGAGAPGEVRTVSGTGFQGSPGVTFGGSIQNLLTNGTGNGTCNFTLDYTVAGSPLDSRVLRAAATERLVLALDDDESDGEAGLVVMVRKFDVPAAPVDSVRLPGTFLVGGQTIFVNPTNSGSDVFVGTVTLAANNGFRLDAVGNQGQDFAYTGTWTLASDGGITLAINGTNETWFAAIDRSYNTLVFVDDFVESRSNNLPELNLGFGVRRRDG